MRVDVARGIIGMTDNGPHGQRNLHEYLFPFYTKQRDGIGLGMPIAKKIVEAHRGEIYVESSQGEGTKVRIVLPYRAGV